MGKGWSRVRFQTAADDPRPVKFPPPGPYWITGEAGDGSYSTIVAYVRHESEVYEYWPEAEETDVLGENEPIRFTSRFPAPDWWVRQMRTLMEKGGKP